MVLGGIFRLSLEPAVGKFLEGHLSVLGVAGLEAALQFFGGVGDVLPDAALGNGGRDLDRFCLADLFAARTVTVADGDLISPLV